MLSNLLKYPVCFKAIIFIAAFSGKNIVFSQLGEPQPRFHNYTIADGLPSSETYSVYQDKKGYIWICTDRGVTRFDGYRFQNFTITEGLTDNVVFKVYEDYKGRIWFITYNSKLCYFENEKIHLYKYNDIIFNSQQNAKVSAQKMIYIDNNDKLYMSIGFNGMFTIDKTGKLEKYEKGKHMVISKVHGQLFWIFDHKDYSSVPHVDSVEIIPDYKKYGGKIGKTYAFGRFFVASTANEEFFMGNDYLYSLNSGKKILDEDNAISLYTHNESVWIGAFKNGVIQIPDIKHPHTSFRYLKDYSVSSVLCDKEGGYWFTTLEKGVFYTPSLNIKNYTVEQGLIDNEVTSVAGLGNNIYIGFLLSRWQNIGSPPYYNQTEKLYRNYILFGSSYKNFYISSKHTFELKNGKLRELHYSWSADYFREKESVLFGIQNVFRAHDDGTLDLIYDYNKDKSSVRENTFQTLMSDGDGRVWIGRLSGLAYVKNGSMSLHGLDDPLFKIRVSDLLYHPSWKSIAATRGEGIYFFDHQKIFCQLKVKDGLLSDLINIMFIDEYGGIWVGTNKGLNYITKNTSGKIHIQSFTTFHGLISNEISSIYAYNGTVYVGTKAGLSIINTKLFKRNKHGKNIYVTVLKTQTRILNPAKHNIFGFQESNIQISFRNTNYRTLKDWNYQYRFNKTSEWINTQVPEIALVNPLPGEYNLEIRYLNEDGIWSVPQMVTSFSIDEAIYKKWYFFATITLLIGLVSWRFFRWRIRQLKQRHRLNNKINQLEQKALQAQMNPHFIFNALNSIQSFLVYEENEKAEKYLLKFAQLIRQTLVNSRDPYITVEGELDILQRYLDLERMRFRNKFSYTIHNMLNTDQMSFKIPNMLIQPFVENAVIHGFSTLHSDGIIDITLKPVDENQIICIVEDNGVGRKKTLLQSSKSHVSFGTSITEERLKAFEIKHGLHLKIETIDIENFDGSTGTRVIINLPISSQLMNEDF